MSHSIATFNTGSSSLKFALYEVSGETLGACRLRCNLKDLYGELIVSLGKADPETQDAIEAVLDGLERTPAAILPAMLEYLSRVGLASGLVAVGHRIVHGGRDLDGPRQVKDGLLAELKALSVFAPDHQPHNLAGVEALGASHPHLLQVLSFDTAFHRTIADAAQVYAIPKHFAGEGLLRYGFHGLSYKHIAEHAPSILNQRTGGRLIAAHLGSGASLCAIKDGKSVATTMGLTALSGIPMATRSGDIDPGLMLYLLQEQGLSPNQLADILYHKSGLLGLSGLSADTRVLIKDKSAPARNAIAHYTDRISREMGSLAVALGGLDTIVFTGGVGENSTEIRRQICASLSWLGVELDEAANHQNAQTISSQTSSVSVLVIPADEERIIAEETLAVWRQI